MNPSENKPGLNLPPPVSSEQQPTPATPNEGTPKSPENLPFAAERAVANSQPTPPAAPSMALPAMPTAAPGTSQTDVTTTTPTTLPSVADDGDLIEKEWVHKAKQIVEQTKEDPHLQSQELNVFKADYMKKRYNKTIRLSE
jgi:hypothetical protein